MDGLQQKDVGMVDICVVGGGLAGSLAALTARRAGAQVVLARRGWGATALSSGGFHIAHVPRLSAGLATAADRCLRDELREIAARQPLHPYGILGTERATEGIANGWDVLRSSLTACALDPGPLDMGGGNIGVASSLGTIVQVAAALPSMTGLSHPGSGPAPDVFRGAPWGIVQLQGDTYFNADRISAGLAFDIEKEFGFVPTLQPLSIPVAGDASAAVLARRLETAAAQEQLVAALAPHAKSFAGFVAPPVLGLGHAGDTWRKLCDAVGRPVVESVARVPSVPGMRIQTALDRAVADAGVEVVGGVLRPRCAGRQVNDVLLESGAQLRARAYILATGRFAGGGIVWGGRGTEALFDLPLRASSGALPVADPLGLVREAPEDAHPLLGAGVQVNANMQPLDAGRSRYDNLFAAGAVIGGFASRHARCADGVAMATASWAAWGALEIL